VVDVDLGEVGDPLANKTARIAWALMAPSAGI
jgi:hypothetical protein